ncbi:MAG: ABC transporter ATP-binding protein [Actinomycetales bacterium]|nr:ABC transporter ATP-binding protein [Actinomycetales bacterium]
MTAVPRSTLRAGAAVVARGMREQPRWFAVAVLGSAVYGIMTGAMAWVIGRLTETVIGPAIAARAVSAGQLWQIGLTISAVVLLNVAGIVLRRVGAGYAMFGLGAAYRQRVTRQYLELPLSWHHKHPSGQLLSNANADVEATWNIFAPLPMALGVVVMLLFGAVQMVVVNPLLAAVAMVVFPLLFAANALFQRRMSPQVTRAQQLRADVSEVAHESFEAALIVKALGREDQEAARFAEVTYQLRDANIAVGRTRGTFDPAIESIPTVGTLVVIAVGAWQASRGQVSAAEVVQIAYLFSVLSFPVRAFGWVLGEVPRAVVGWDRVNAVLQATGAMEFGAGSLPPGASALPIAARSVGYAYEVENPSGGSERAPVLRDVTIDVTAGGTTAIVGPTGSGKSTLAGVLVRLVDPDTGAILVDGVDLRQLRHGALAEAAAFVPQQTFLFEDTVRGNVTLGLAVSDDQVWAALRLARAEGFVSALPGGLDTLVGERGANLSGGQRQRIALARAVVRNPRLLVLDDATSAIDPSVEQEILAGLRQAVAGTTVLVIASRMATITLADEVVFLADGRVVDHGPHDELIQRCRPYADLVTAYARDAAERADTRHTGAAEVTR